MLRLQLHQISEHYEQDLQSFSTWLRKKVPGIRPVIRKSGGGSGQYKQARSLFISEHFAHVSLADILEQHDKALTTNPM